MSKPVKFLKTAISGISVAATATVNGTAGIPFQWNATLAITAQVHSDSTSVPLANFYTGNNVNVNDWIVSSAEGNCLRIASISAQNSTTVTCVLEDTGYINALSDSTGNMNGLIQNGAGIVAYVFSVVGNVPLLSGIPTALPGNLSSSFSDNIISKFMSNYGGSGIVGSDIFLLGVLSNTNKRFQANITAFSKPEIRYNFAATEWEMSVDGVTFSAIGTPQWSSITGKPTTIAGYGITDALSATGNIATATKLANARSITASGDVSGTTSFDGSANAAIVLTLANEVAAGTGTKLSYNTKGLVTGNTNLVASDLPGLDWSKITTGTPTTLAGYGITDGIVAGASFSFFVNFTGADPGSVSGLPTGWTSSISGDAVTINHTAGLPLAEIFYWGISTVGGVQNYRLPSASNAVTIPIANLNSQFIATLNTAITGADTNGSVRVVVKF